MGTIVAQTIINRAAGALLADTNKVRFIESQLLEFLNEACRVIASINPSAYSAFQTITLVAGTKQSLPAGAHLLVRPRRNMGVGAPTPGLTITVVDGLLLDVLRPGWHTETPVNVIKHVIYDDKQQTTFWVYPPANASVQIECLLALVPADILIGATILLDDVYEAVIMNYILARAYEKDTEYAGNEAKATFYYGLVAQQLGAKATAVMGAGAGVAASAKTGGT